MDQNIKFAKTHGESGMVICLVLFPMCIFSFCAISTNLQPCSYANIPLNCRGAKITIEGVNKKPYENGENFIFVKNLWQICFW